MNRKTIVLAAAAAIATPAIVLADASTVTLYGTLNADFENVRARGCSSAGASCVDFPGRNRVNSNSSNIGIRGSEPLGGGNNAWFQVENSVNLDVGGGTWASRNSAVGLNGGWGSVLLGQWDTPYKVTAAKVDPWGNTTIAVHSSITGGGSTPTTANAANRASFDRRQQNSVQYWTPNLGGFSARVAYGANEERSATGAAISSNPRLWSVQAQFERGPVFVGAAYERHEDYANTATVKTDDKAWMVGGGFTFAGAHTISAMFERIEYEGNLGSAGALTGSPFFLTTIAGLPKAFSCATCVGSANEAELDTWYVSYLGRFGPNNVRVTYGQNQEIEIDGRSAPNTKARQWSVGYGYSLSKRTEVYALYTQIKNDSNSWNNFAINSSNALGLTGQSRGADPRGYGVGIKHTF